MKLLASITGIILTMWVSISYAGNWTDGMSLKDYCSSESFLKQSFCKGFISAATAAASSQIFCDPTKNSAILTPSSLGSCEKTFAIDIPPSMEPEQATDIVVKYLNQHPEKLHEEGYSLVSQALAGAFKFKAIGWDN